MIRGESALAGIKTAGEKDWRALAAWLTLTFPEHPPGNRINISATAQQAVVCDLLITPSALMLAARLAAANVRM